MNMVPLSSSIPSPSPVHLQYTHDQRLHHSGLQPLIVSARPSFPGYRLSSRAPRIIMAAVGPEVSKTCRVGHNDVPDSEGIGNATTDELTPHDMWIWNARMHWKHWHGQWALYHPLVGSNIVKSYNSVRSFWPVDKDCIHVYHINQCYATTGEGPNMNWEYGPWPMYEHKHSLPDGIWHPQSIDHRILQFPHGDLGWVQLALKPNDPKSVVFNELHFMTTSGEARMAVIIGYDFEGKLGIALQLEEVRDTDKRPPESWKGTLWKHHSEPLVASRKEPQGVFVGTETSLSTSLFRTTCEAKWRGFSSRGGLNEDVAALYTLVHLPNHVTACVPKEAPIGKTHAYYVTWVVNEDQVRVLSARYFADGRLQYVKSGTYNKVRHAAQ